SLIYAVYFTELGKPESSESDQQITIYDQTAAPTLFVKWQTVPTVKLVWAYASQNLLKFSLKIYDLGPNIDPADWICNPYITMDKPVPRRLSSYQMGTVYDKSGESIQATYEYEINASGYDSLAIDMDITIGPCADYLNFQESNVTASVLPELVGNYHLRFQVPVKIITPSSSTSLAPTSTETGVWRDMPIFPGGIESNDTTADQPVYHYIIENADIDAVQRFYKSQMKSDGWQLLGVEDSSGATRRKAYTLWFAKDQNVVTIDIFVKENVTHVMISPD
ncbi:MAG TPA: hypothetical protein VJL10_06420, partial [Anaerolineales bacterium]|nr:hypothetical protein [Anaerolineales bacterium]